MVQVLITIYKLELESQSRFISRELKWTVVIYHIWGLNLDSNSLKFTLWFGVQILLLFWKKIIFYFIFVLFNFVLILGENGKENAFKYGMGWKQKFIGSRAVKIDENLLCNDTLVDSSLLLKKEVIKPMQT